MTSDRESPASESTVFKSIRRFNKEEIARYMSNAVVVACLLIFTGSIVATVVQFGFSWWIVVGVIGGIVATFVFLKICYL